MTETDRPLVIIVGGSPASGKSTLAKWLAEEFRLPLLSRDELKEAMMDTLGAPTPDSSRELGAAAYAILSTLLERLLDADVGSVLESNFRRGVSEDDLKPILAKSTAIAIYCHATLEESLRRYQERAEDGDRHPGHHDEDPSRLADLERDISTGLYDPLDLEIPFLKVDTTVRYDPNEEEIVRFVRQHA